MKGNLLCFVKCLFHQRRLLCGPCQWADFQEWKSGLLGRLLLPPAEMWCECSQESQQCAWTLSLLARSSTPERTLLARSESLDFLVLILGGRVRW